MWIRSSGDLANPEMRQVKNMVSPAPCAQSAGNGSPPSICEMTGLTISSVAGAATRQAGKRASNRNERIGPPSTILAPAIGYGSGGVMPAQIFAGVGLFGGGDGLRCAGGYHGS